MQKLKTVDADTLLYQPLDKPCFVVDGLIPTGLSLFCGSQKIGKSWLMLKLCLCVSQGSPFWEMPTTQSDVLYLCLEDTFYRIQSRLFKLTDEASERLHFAVASGKLTDGLVGQLEDYLKAYPDSRLIVIDTLQKIRTSSKENAYANDYGDISIIKDFADRHSLSEIWQLITQSPEQFKGGTIWNVIVDIHGAVQAIGLALLVLFFVIGVMKTCGSFAEVKLFYRTRTANYTV